MTGYVTSTRVVLIYICVLYYLCRSAYRPHFRQMMMVLSIREIGRLVIQNTVIMVRTYRPARRVT